MADVVMIWQHRVRVGLRPALSVLIRRRGMGHRDRGTGESLVTREAQTLR